MRHVYATGASAVEALDRQPALRNTQMTSYDRPVNKG
jgi:hypothetical protein